jgi:hypothetical protein
MTFIGDFNAFVAQFLPREVWCITEILCGLAVFYFSLYQRVYVKNFSLQSSYPWIITKLGQLGLYIHMVLSVVVIIDGYETFVNSVYIPHVILIGVMAANLMVKYNLIYSIVKKEVIND